MIKIRQVLIKIGPFLIKMVDWCQNLPMFYNSLIQLDWKLDDLIDFQSQQPIQPFVILINQFWSNSNGRLK